jgi:Tfp pilus assembly protein PilE
MPTGRPSSTGDILTAASYNSLVSFTITTNTNDATAVLNDQYQVLEVMNKSTAIAFNLPTNASVAFPIGTVITVLNIGTGTCTIKAVTSGTTTVLSAGATAAQPTLAQYRSAACIKTGTDTWYVVGAIA